MLAASEWQAVKLIKQSGASARPHVYPGRFQASFPLLRYSPASPKKCDNRLNDCDSRIYVTLRCQVTVIYATRGVVRSSKLYIAA